MNAFPSAVHMIGVAGMGMTPLALYLNQAGVVVTGEDDGSQALTRKVLNDSGVDILSDKEASFAREQAPLIVYSSAVSVDDPRLVEARRQGIALLRRGELLARLVEGRKLLAVAGSHGKTTTVAMMIHALHKQGFTFDYLLGGLFREGGLLPAHYEGAEWVVAEVDESDGTIECFKPEMTLVVNADWDHPDKYPDPNAFEAAMRMLAERTHSCVIMPAEGLPDGCIPARRRASLIRFGMHRGDYVVKVTGNSRDVLDLELGGRFDSSCVRVAAAGMFNAWNALAALTSVHVLCGSFCKTLLEDFPGVNRRQDVLYEDEDLRVIADYAHHPAEVEALLTHLRAHAKRALGVVFQPHRYSRTRQYAEDFAAVLQTADKLVVLPVYAASETPLEEGDATGLLKWLPQETTFCETKKALWKVLDKCIQDVDTLVFVGAGDIGEWACEYADGLRFKRDVFEQVRSGFMADTLLASHEPLARRTTLRIGGEARWYAEPAGVEDLQVLLRVAHEAGVKVFFLGRGSNLIIHDEGFNGLVVHLRAPHWQFIRRLDGDRLEVGAAVRLQALSTKACKWGLRGFEFLEGIPGSVGGALRMNAGAMGSWMFELVEEVRLVTKEGAYQCLPREACQVAYRSCHELTDAVAVSAVLRAPGNEDEAVIRERMRQFARKRLDSQPKDPSAGCIFKNPEGLHAGKLIDELGLKGYAVGKAEVSRAHANFIVNRGGASCADVLELIRNLRERVKAVHGVELEPEAILVGKSWEEVL